MPGSDPECEGAASLNPHEARLNDFYARFPYPPRSTLLEQVGDPDHYRRMLCQDLGDYHHTRVPEGSTIWVAGCGTNQALVTALRFPTSAVLGTDASTASIRACMEGARDLQVSNLTLKQEGLTAARYQGEFDYILCTGVIHHNPAPAQVLRRLAAALRPQGVLELMVYNQDHRREIAAFRQALRLLGNDEAQQAEERLELARRLATSLPAGSAVTRALHDSREMPDEAWADAWINPCEHSYSIMDLRAMAEECGLVVEAPCANQFDVTDKRSWELDFADADLQDRYENLDDHARWWLTGLVQQASSPHLWFYLSPSVGRRGSERERNEAFTHTTFYRVRSSRRIWLLDEAGRYVPVDRGAPFPGGSPLPEVRRIYDAVDGRATMGDLYEKLGIAHGLSATTRTRQMLTTTQFPFLLARTAAR